MRSESDSLLKHIFVMVVIWVELQLSEESLVPPTVISTSTPT